MIGLVFLIVGSTKLRQKKERAKQLPYIPSSSLRCCSETDKAIKRNIDRQRIRLEQYILSSGVRRCSQEVKRPFGTVSCHCIHLEHNPCCCITLTKERGVVASTSTSVYVRNSRVADAAQQKTRRPFGTVSRQRVRL